MVIYLSIPLLSFSSLIHFIKKINPWWIKVMSEKEKETRDSSRTQTIIYLSLLLLSSDSSIDFSLIFLSLGLMAVSSSSWFLTATSDKKKRKKDPMLTNHDFGFTARPKRWNRREIDGEPRVEGREGRERHRLENIAKDRKVKEKWNHERKRKG